MQNINFTSLSSYLLLNPKTPDSISSKLNAVFLKLTSGKSTYKDLTSHIFLQTSGTGGAPKLVALSKNALLASAHAVNTHINSTSLDIWALVLPTFHVGGLSVLTRAHASGARVVEYDARNNTEKIKWNPINFLDLLTSYNASLTSLVPTQLYDLVTLKLSPPKSLRACFVGGGSLSPNLFRDALLLGWPVLPSFGMTECCSQIATCSLDRLDNLLSTGLCDVPPNHTLELLPHLKAKIINERLALYGDSLLTGYIDIEGNFIDPKENSWFTSDDFATLKQQSEKTYIIPYGRASKVIKIKGELVSLEKISASLTDDERYKQGMLITSIPHPRDEHQIVLVGSSLKDDLENTAARINRSLQSFEKIKGIVSINDITKTELGKIKEEELRDKIVAVLTAHPNYTPLSQ